MYYLAFKDDSIYQKSKNSILLTTGNIEKEPIIVDIQHIGNDCNWNSCLPTETYFKKLEEKKTGDKIKDELINSEINFWNKYRKYHKRKEYSLIEFNNFFTILPKNVNM